MRSAKPTAQPGRAAGDGEITVGKNAVDELIRSGRPVYGVLVARGSEPKYADLSAACRARGIPVQTVDTRKLDALAGGAVHQGIGAVSAAYRYRTLDELLERARQTGGPAFYVICDGIEDPRNLGAIVRTADGAGVTGIILPERHSAAMTPAAAKAASGALETVPIARVVNLVSAIDTLRNSGVWTFAADMDGEPWCRADCTVPLALVIGSEGRGVRRLVKEHCDRTLALPMLGSLSSLNASVAAGVLMYEVLRQRRY